MQAIYFVTPVSRLDKFMRGLTEDMHISFLACLDISQNAFYKIDVALSQYFYSRSFISMTAELHLKFRNDTPPHAEMMPFIIDNAFAFHVAYCYFAFDSLSIDDDDAASGSTQPRCHIDVSICFDRISFDTIDLRSPILSRESRK